MVYEIYDESMRVIARLPEEKEVALFFFGVMWGGGEIVNFTVTRGGRAVIKTLIINKYFPKQ